MDVKSIEAWWRMEYWSNGMVECGHSAGYKGQRKWSGVVMEYEIIEYLKVSEEF